MKIQMLVVIGNSRKLDQWTFSFMGSGGRGDQGLGKWLEFDTCGVMIIDLVLRYLRKKKKVLLYQNPGQFMAMSGHRGSQTLTSHYFLATFSKSGKIISEWTFEQRIQTEDYSWGHRNHQILCCSHRNREEKLESLGFRSLMWRKWSRNDSTHIWKCRFSYYSHIVRPGQQGMTVIEKIFCCTHRSLKEGAHYILGERHTWGNIRTD